MKLLLAEDERDLSAAVSKMLTRSGFTVDAVFNGRDALDYLVSAQYDVAVLDIMMPKMDGITIVKNLREKGNNIPVLLLTAKAEIDDRVLGLNSGADDYLTKPFAMKELIARIRALTRRSSGSVNVYSFGNITLNPDTYELKGKTGSVRLTRREFQMIEHLLLNHDKYVSAEKFMDRIWDFDSEAELSVVWVFISTIRKKLKSVGANVQISAVRGIGYRIEVI